MTTLIQLDQERQVAFEGQSGSCHLQEEVTEPKQFVLSSQGISTLKESHLHDATISHRTTIKQFVAIPVEGSGT